MLEEKVEIKADEYGDFVRMMREKVSVGADGIVKISDGLWFGMADLIEGLGRELFEKRECAEKNDDAGSFRQPSAAASLPEGCLGSAEGDSDPAEVKDERDTLEDLEAFFEDEDGEDGSIGGEIYGAAVREASKEPEDEYRCETCINAGTPLCEHCNAVRSPDGSTSRPTKFLGFKEIDTVRQRIAVLSYNIDLYIRKGQPLPLRWVIEYNDLLCGKVQKN